MHAVQVQERLGDDRVLKEIFRYVPIGTWSQRVRTELLPFYNKRDSLGREDGCLFYGKKLVIPKNNK